MDFPYGMHPDVDQSGQGFELQPFRERQRIWKLFIGGYHAQFVCREKGRYGELSATNRFEIIEEALDFYGDQTRSAGTDKAFSKHLNSDWDGFTFIDSDQYHLLGKAWFNALSLADFFLAAPGTTYPMSQNCVESLGVGTIPILEYANVFSPALTDGVNCLTNQGKEGLGRTLRRLQTLETWGTGKLRQGAAEDYEKHLGPEGIFESLMQPEVSKLHLHAHLAMPTA